MTGRKEGGNGINIAFHSIPFNSYNLFSKNLLLLSGRGFIFLSGFATHPRLSISGGTKPRRVDTYVPKKAMLFIQGSYIPNVDFLLSSSYAEETWNLSKGIILRRLLSLGG